MRKEPVLQDVQNTSKQITPFVHRTPVLTSQSVNSIIDGEVFFKCENFQKTGSFKMRGASNAVLSLSEEESKRGVVTVSSGNHGAALACAAKLNGMKSHVVTPKNTQQVKIDAMKGYGANLIYCEPSVESRESTFINIQEKTGAIPIHPYNDYRVITGAGTVALEIIDEVKDLDFILVPIGGGGLISGTGVVVSSLRPNTKLLGVEPESADDALRSIKSGEIVPSDYPPTIADGLRSSLGEKTFPMIQKFVDDIQTVSEEEIISSMRFVWERMKIIVEPSSAVTMAAVLNNPASFRGKKTGVIFSGGNIDLSHLPW
ncbi:MAG: serine dehydratase [Candidatus Marinimicrobia bacterium]|nr:serine dehydratase [Candidatus Neomarinimicrobiota bacterium]